MDSIMLGYIAAQEDKRQNCRQRRCNLRKKSNVMSLSATEFKKNFRLNKTAFRNVLSEIENDFPPQRHGGLSVSDKLAACLRFFAEGSYQHGTGKDYDVAIAQPTFSKILSEMLDILERRICSKWINFEMTANEKYQANRYFFEKSRIPGIIMCVDGTHIKIIPPKVDRNLYYNRKGFYSLNAMIMCDHTQRIRFIDSSYQGSNHDSHVWGLSSARAHLRDMHRNGNTNIKILGDAGYPSEPWLITPYRAPEPGSPESDFNSRHSLGRGIIERTIGVLKNRFRCILGSRQLHYAPAKAAKIVNVCCALHNVCSSYMEENDLEDV
ncbi:putative nuclease HARBI1 [Wyeomyia smithii]|uniref:putative nuclease HARBI1 n=1 Tax=Wyeomyia smithii TaxID=174621 RepID=UPI002467B8B6|nr:putative nuclease HARBI1 [Wyeomyia smithii]